MKGGNVNIKVDEIRKAQGFTNQLSFAQELGMSKRAYLLRISGDQDWRIGELIKVAEYENTIHIDHGGKTYKVTIVED